MRVRQSAQANNRKRTKLLTSHTDRHGLEMQRGAEECGGVCGDTWSAGSYSYLSSGSVSHDGYMILKNGFTVKVISCVTSARFAIFSYQSPLPVLYAAVLFPLTLRQEKTANYRDSGRYRQIWRHRAVIIFGGDGKGQRVFLDFSMHTAWTTGQISQGCGKRSAARRA